jgi:hypothetical protein
MIAMLLYRQLVSCGVPGGYNLFGNGRQIFSFGAQLKRLIIYSYITLVLGLAIYEPTLLGQIQAPTIKDYSSMCGICKMTLYYIDSTTLDLTKSFVYCYANVQWAVTIL